MHDYGPQQIRLYFNSLKGLQEVLVRAASTSSTMLSGQEVTEYEELLADAQHDLPGLLKSFDKQSHFSHNNGGRHSYYNGGGILSHIARNLAILKTHLQTNSETTSPVTEKKDFSFVQNDALKAILERDYQEIQRSIVALNWKSAIILSGGSVEALLLDALTKDETSSRASEKAPSESNLNKWDLNSLIEVAVDLETVGEEVGKLSHSVRQYRNLIHPGRELRDSLKVEPEEAKIAYEVLNILIRDLSI